MPTTVNEFAEVSFTFLAQAVTYTSIDVGSVVSKPTNLFGNVHQRDTVALVDSSSEYRGW
jgi:hypothetical protein